MIASSPERHRTTLSPRKLLWLAVVAATAAAVLTYFAPFFATLLLAAAISGALSFGLEWLSLRYRKNLTWIGVGVGVFAFGILSRDLMPRDSVIFSERAIVAAQYLAVWLLVSTSLQLVFHLPGQKRVNEDAV